MCNHVTQGFGSQLNIPTPDSSFEAPVHHWAVKKSRDLEEGAHHKTQILKCKHQDLSICHIYYHLYWGVYVTNVLDCCMKINSRVLVPPRDAISATTHPGNIHYLDIEALM